MSESTTQGETRCISCGINVAGTSAARFKCPDCGTLVFRCAKCRKQSTLYECTECGFTGP